jgi:hypothetical protein
MTIDPWPELPLSEWKDTLATLHMWTQIVGKIRLKLSPLQNHWWNVPLYVTPNGLTTSSIPYNDRLFQINFDFINHILTIETTDGSTKTIALRPRTVAEFYQETMAALESLKMPITIWTTPVEVPDRTPFGKIYPPINQTQIINLCSSHLTFMLIGVMEIEPKVIFRFHTTLEPICVEHIFQF